MARARERHDCLIIGGGPGGLGTAALLRRAGVEPLILERGGAPLAKWRSSYDRLCINTSSWFSHPPGQRFPRRAGMFPTRDEFVASYDRYAARHDLRVLTSVQVEKLEPGAGGWRALTATGTFDAQAAVVATGKQRTPVIPQWEGRERFERPMVHSAHYRRAGDFDVDEALVVGAGNSAMDIALDLADAGAKVWMAVRRPPHIRRRAVLGLPHDLFGVLSRHLPRPVVDSGSALIARLTVGDLTHVGVAPPGDGAVSRLEVEGRVPTVDAGGFVSALEAGRIEVVGDVESFQRQSVRLRDGRVLEPHLVVAATGYRADLENLVGHLGVLDRDGLPLPEADLRRAAPGLHFVGFHDPRSGLLRELRLDARRISQTVARELGGRDGAPVSLGATPGRGSRPTGPATAGDRGARAGSR